MQHLLSAGDLTRDEALLILEEIGRNAPPNTLQQPAGQGGGTARAMGIVEAQEEGLVVFRQLDAPQAQRG